MITENHNYNRPLVDLRQLLIEQKIFESDKMNKYKLFTVNDNRSLFSLLDNKLFVSSKIDREAICPQDSSNQKGLLSKYNFINDGSCTNTDCCTLFSFQVESEYEMKSYHILIIVLDQNDNVPKFLPFNNPYITIPENTPINTVLDLPLATDADSKIFGIKNYSILKPFQIGNASHFSLSNKMSLGKSSLIVISSLDREKNQKYRFVLKAHDRENDISHDTNDVEVEIKITDVNDNIPSFDKSLYTISIKEHSRIQDLIYFKVSDPDEGVNSEVSISIHVENEIERHDITKLFRVDFNRPTMTGSLRIIEDLDYETHKHSFSFNLVANDNGKPSLSSSSRVSILVLNENDHAPEIKITRQGKTITRSINIIENEPSGTLVAFLQISDKDSPVSNIECQLLDSQLNFQIKSSIEEHPLGYYKEYTIRTLKPLDREDERNTHISIYVHCTDHDKFRPLSTNLTILVNIEDINDNPPIFTRNKYQGELIENNPHSTIKMIEPIHSNDKDYGINALVIYKIDTTDNSTDWQLFSINAKSGIIYSKTSVDYEESKMFQFSIKAIDKKNEKLSSVAMVVIHIIDANDNAPIFVNSHYSFTVKENVPLNTIIGQIFATDADTKIENKKIKFFEKFPQNSPSFIHVDQNTGKLRTIGSIDREKTKSISMQIVAKNEIGYQNNNLIDPDCMIVILVEDENDNPPIFTLIDQIKTSMVFFINSMYKQDNCQQIPYTVTDADQDESSSLDCCTLKLDQDYNGNFYLTSTMPNFLCLRNTVNSQATYRITVTAKDNKNNQNNSLQAKVSFNAFIKNEIVESNNIETIENRIPSNKLPFNKNSNFSLIIVIVIVVIICLLIIAFVLLVLYKYVVNGSEEIPKRQDTSVNDNTIQSSENNILKMKYNPNMWPREEENLMYHLNTQRKDNFSYSKPPVNQEWYFEKPIYNKESQESYQSMTTPIINVKYCNNSPITYEPLCLIPSSTDDYFPIENKTICSAKYKSNTTKNSNTEKINNNKDNQAKYCQTSFV